MAPKKPVIQKVSRSQKKRRNGSVVKCACLFCSALFTSKYCLEIHINSKHTKERPFQCSNCDANFSDRSALSAHQKYVHLKVKLVCSRSSCRKIFSSYSSMSAHKKRHAISRGNGEDSKTCCFCEKNFATNAELEMHMNTHTRERPFQCEKCNVNFGHRSCLYRHRQKCLQRGIFVGKIKKEIQQHPKSTREYVLSMGLEDILDTVGDNGQSTENVGSSNKLTTDVDLGLVFESNSSNETGIQQENEDGDGIITTTGSIQPLDLPESWEESALDTGSCGHDFINESDDNCVISSDSPLNGECQDVQNDRDDSNQNEVSGTISAPPLPLHTTEFPEYLMYTIDDLANSTGDNDSLKLLEEQDHIISWDIQIAPSTRNDDDHILQRESGQHVNEMHSDDDGPFTTAVSTISQDYRDSVHGLLQKSSMDPFDPEQSSRYSLDIQSCINRSPMLEYAFNRGTSGKDNSSRVKKANTSLSCPFCQFECARKKHLKNHIGLNHRIRAAMALEKGSAEEKQCLYSILISSSNNKHNELILDGKNES